MPTVDKSIIKEWFKNLKKPNQDQFWTWMDSFYHKMEGIAIDAITGLQDILNKKADLVGGVVPAHQLPFTINTNEVINIGLIEVTTNSVKINVHESGSNKVRINGQIISRTFPNTFPFTPVSTGKKFLRIVAKDSAGLFFMKESAESDEPQEPSLDPGEIHVRLILITPTGSYIDPQVLNGFKEKAEDNWKTFFPNKLSVYSLTYSDARTCFSLEETIPLTAPKEIRTIQFAQETNRDVEFTIKNNSAGPVVIQSFQTENLNKGFANENLPFTIPTKGTLFAKYNHFKNQIEILKVGSADFTFVTDATLQGNGTTANPAGLSVAKNAEIVGKLDKASATTQVVSGDISFTAKITASQYNYLSSTANAVPLKDWTDGTFRYFTNSAGINKVLAFESELKYGNSNPPTLAQLTTLGIKKGDFYVRTSNGSSTGTEIRRALFNGAQLVKWTVTSAEYNALSQDQKNAVEELQILV